VLWKNKRQSRRDARNLLLVVVSFIAAVASAAAQAPISINSAYPIEECSVAGRDSFLLTQIYGSQLDQSLTYTSSNTLSGFTGTLSGTYLNQPVNISYSGDFTSYDSTGAIRWTSSGNFGSDTWSGGGTATFTSGTKGFNVNFNSSESSGSNSSSTLTDVTASGLPDIVFTGTTGQIIVNGRVVPGWAHTMQVNPDGSCDGHYNPIGQSITVIDTPSFVIPTLSATPVALPIRFNILPQSAAATPTLPEWAAIFMGFTLVAFSLWRISRSRARTAT
jgi:hypothetical protein